jgi:sodium transport system permease protein
MRPLIVWHIYRKDLVETLRDRRALFTTLVLPLVLYPLLFTAIGSFTSNKREQIASQLARIAVWGPVPERAVQAVVAEKATVVDRRASVPPASEELAGKAVTDKTVDVVLVTPEGPAGPSVQVKVYADSTQFESEAMQERVLKVLRKHEAALLEERMVALGQPTISARPLLVEEVDLSSSARRAAALVGSILPYMVLVLLSSAAFYSAIDLTAGEKERGTLQTLLTAPVHALEVVAGKYLAVVTMTLVAALANIVSLGLAIGRILSEGGQGGSGFHMGPRVGLTLFFTLVPAALLLSALFVAVGVMARTYKEGQSYLMPLLFLVIFAALGSTLPGVELTPALALVPLTNVALLMRELLSGRATLFLGTEVVISSFAYAAMGVVLAARVFETEQVLLSGEKPWKDIFARKAKGGLTPLNTLFFVALLVVVVFYGTVPLMLAAGKDQIGRAISVSELGFFLLPALLWALLMRVPLRDAFQLRLPSRRGMLGTALLVLGGWSVGLLIGAVLSRFQGARDYSEQLGELLGKNGPLTLGMAALLVGLLPAVCEEACFRGVVLTGLGRSGSRSFAVVGSALAFGLFHINPYQVAAASTLGLVLGYAAYESRSLLPGVLMHFVNNGLQLVMVRVPEARAFFESKVVVAAGLLLTALALWLLRGSGSAGPAPGATPLRPAGEVRA